MLLTQSIVCATEVSWLCQTKSPNLIIGLGLCASICRNYINIVQFIQCHAGKFEASAEPLQDWLNSTEVRVQESSARLHDLPAKKQELSKLQVFWIRELWFHPVWDSLT
uniref:Uncharacterized protein n=1 Tax=Seriola dumerili TaxID=41447 RepID=A0A3B4V7G6_SERDU